MQTMTYVDEVHEQASALQNCWEYYKKHWDDGLNFISEQIVSASFTRVIFSGMGSSLFAGEVPRTLLNRRGIPTMLVEAGSLTNSISRKILETSLLVLTSQSGESGEIVQFLDHAHAEGWKLTIAAVTNNPESTLGRNASVVLPLRAGSETSVTSKTYLCTLLAHYLITQACIDPACEPEQLESPISGVIRQVKGQLDEALLDQNMLDFFRETTHIEFLSTGTGMATAHQAALNTKEIVKISAEALSFGQFRHGGIEMIDSSFRPVLICNHPSGRPACENLTRGILTKWGGKFCYLLTIQATNPTEFGSKDLFQFHLIATQEGLSPILEMLPIQQLLIELARERGFTPGEFRYSSKITRE